MGRVKVRMGMDSSKDKYVEKSWMMKSKFRKGKNTFFKITSFQSYSCRISDFFEWTFKTKIRKNDNIFLPRLKMFSCPFKLLPSSGLVNLCTLKWVGRKKAMTHIPCWKLDDFQDKKRLWEVSESRNKRQTNILGVRGEAETAGGKREKRVLRRREGNPHRILFISQGRFSQRFLKDSKALHLQIRQE